MAYQALNLGTLANDGTGDDLRTGGGKINANFVELYARATTAATDPTTTDDGYEVGTVWVNTTANTVFLLADNTASNAVWVEVLQSIDGGSAAG